MGAPLVLMGWHPPRLSVPLPPLSPPAAQNPEAMTAAYPGSPGPKAGKRLCV